MENINYSWKWCHLEKGNFLKNFHFRGKLLKLFGILSTNDRQNFEWLRKKLLHKMLIILAIPIFTSWNYQGWNFFITGKLDIYFSSKRNNMGISCLFMKHLLERWRGRGVLLLWQEGFTAEVTSQAVIIKYEGLFHPPPPLLHYSYIQLITSFCSTLANVRLNIHIKKDLWVFRIT
jgi:hypothetical protein